MVVSGWGLVLVVVLAFLAGGAIGACGILLRFVIPLLDRAPTVNVLPGGALAPRSPVDTLRDAPPGEVEQLPTAQPDPLFQPETLERGTQQLYEEARARGMPITIEEAREEAARLLDELGGR